MNQLLRAKARPLMFVIVVVLAGAACTGPGAPASSAGPAAPSVAPSVAPSAAPSAAPSSSGGGYKY
jgi:hypothetical protein